MSKTSNRKSYFAMANKFLQIRAAQGDARARPVLCHRIAVWQMHSGKAKGLTARYHLCKLGEDVQLHFRKDRETRWHIKMFVEIGEHTSLSAIKMHWEEIRTWRELLLSWQGPWRESGYSELLEILHVLQKRGRSYSNLVQHLNDAVGSDLRTYMENNHDFQKSIENGLIKDHQDLVQWWQQTSEDVWELASARFLLRDMGFTLNEIEQWCTNAIENLVDGRDAFPLGVPRTRDRVISQLRTWHAKYKAWISKTKIRGMS
jgi:hypothetical protein